MNRKFFFSYRVFVWVLLLLAIVLGSGLIVIAYTYNLQKKTEKQVELARLSIEIAKELEVELFSIRNFTFIYIDDKSPEWIDSVRIRRRNFIISLERARNSLNTVEETSLIQQISALFSNFELNLNTATSLVYQGNITQANALLVHSARDLLGTIHQKSRQYISLNQRVGELHKKDIARTNSIIFNVMIALGFGGVVSGLFLGWMISRMLFAPINQLILNVRDASGGAVVEKLKIHSGDELDELGNQINELIARINKTQEDLNRNKQLLQYSNKYAVLGKVAPTIAHEIRNPLTAIKMLIYSLKEGTSFDKSHEKDLSIILSEIDRMEDFIKNFLKFTKPSDPVFLKVNPCDVLSDVLILLAPRFKEKKLELINSCSKSKVNVLADSGQLKQLFMNLLLNALEVLPENGYIKIDSQKVILNELNHKEFIKISIEDSGPGIPEKVMKSLFEPFVKGSEQGVGLGLSISQNIATMHNGWIEAENKTNGTGAIFHLFIPIST